MNTLIRIFVSAEQDGLRVGVRPQADQAPTAVLLSVSEASQFFSQLAFNFKSFGERVSTQAKSAFNIVGQALSAKALPELDGAISVELSSAYLPTLRMIMTDEQAAALGSELTRLANLPKQQRAMVRN